MATLGQHRPPATPQRSSLVWRMLVPVAMLTAGLIFGVSAAVARVEGGAGRATDLVELVRDRVDDVEVLVERTDRLAAEVEELGAERTPLNLFRWQGNRLAPQVGASPVIGNAIQVTLDDAGYSLDTLPEGYTVDDVVVHEQDVHAVVNALWAGGAEAMMVQDQRIISTSAVRCVGNTLYLQGRVYSPPYVITAIGDPAALQQALTDDSTVANYRAWSDILGLGYAVDDVGEQEFPAFSGSVRPQYASVIDSSSLTGVVLDDLNEIVGPLPATREPDVDRLGTESE